MDDNAMSTISPPAPLGTEDSNKTKKDDDAKLAPDKIDTPAVSVVASQQHDWVPLFHKALMADPVALALELCQAMGTVLEGTKNNHNTKEHKALFQSFCFRVLEELACPTSQDKKSTVTQSPSLEFETPYPKNSLSVEHDEPAFIMLEQAGKSIHAMRLFESGLADELVNKKLKITNAYVFYMTEWLEWQKSVPLDLLFLLLPSCRIAKTETGTLHSVVRDFRVHSMVVAALEDYGLASEFPLVRRSTARQFRSDRVSLECLIFVARAYKGMYALRWTDIRSTLSSKLLRCLRLLEDHLRGAQNNNISVLSSASSSPSSNASLPSYTNPTKVSSSYNGKKTTKSRKSYPFSGANGKPNLNQPQLYWSRGEILDMPVEKLCPTSGKVIDTFRTCRDAVRSMSSSVHAEQNFYYSVIGQNKNSRIPNMYKGFLWRLKGSTADPKLGTATSVAQKFDTATPWSAPSVVTSSATLNVRRTPPAKGNMNSNPEDILTKSQILDKPVEQLCISTGKVLRTFPSGREAAKSISPSPHAEQIFHLVLIGKYKNTSGPRIYKGYFWRLQGFSHAPDIEKTKTSSTKPSTPARIPSSNANLDHPERHWSRGETLDLPVEQLCMTSGKIIRTFLTGREAARSMSSSANPEQAFYLALIGKGNNSKSPRVYKGYFWRLQGTTHTPDLDTQTSTEEPVIMEKNVTTCSAITAPSPEELNHPENHWSKREILKMPVEQLGALSGNVVATFPTGYEAASSISSSSQADLQLYMALLGRGNIENSPRMYKNFFWRLKGTSHTPPIDADPKEATEMHDSTGSLQEDTPNAVQPTNSLESLKLYENMYSKSDIMAMPVEMLCPHTGKVLRYFSTATEGRKFVSDASLKQPFLDALFGRGNDPHNPFVYNGYFWRLFGFQHKPKVQPAKNGGTGNNKITAYLKRKVNDGDEDVPPAKRPSNVSILESLHTHLPNVP